VASVKILDQTYTLPVIATERFQVLQNQVQEQQQVIQTGLRPQPRLLGIIPRAPLTLTPEERWQELDQLVHNYDAIIAELRVSQEAYAAFFGQIAAGVRQALARQWEAMQREEEERLADAQHPGTQQDETLQRLVHEDGARLMQGVRLLGQAALLLLKKIALCQEGLARLVSDQDLQRRVLTELTGRLELHRRAYLRRQRIDRLVQDAARMAEVALHFEAYLRDHLGPLQSLLEQVVRVDSDLHRAVAEIEELTRQLVQQQRLTALPGSEMLDERWLTFLTTSQLKKERLVEMWGRLEQQGGDLEALEIDIATSMPNTGSPILAALDNIRTLVDARLAPLVPEHRTREVEVSSAVPRQRAVSISAPEPRLVDRFGIAFVLIPAGTFQMGSHHGVDDEQPVHTVRISQPFYLGLYPVTHRQWEAVMGDRPSHFRGPEHPVEQVSWEKVQEFIRSVNTHEGRTRYRLPTEAEWEYVARAGATGDYCFGDDVTQLSQYAWYADNAQGTAHPVGQLQPNTWGLYDMHGNVWEWVQDWYDAQEYQRRTAAGPAVVDPTGPAAGSHRVGRGGSWSSGSGDCRSASRSRGVPSVRLATFGFRPVRMVQ
jgi:formylglycine-generating enzyme required for sulfatase activity